MLRQISFLAFVGCGASSNLPPARFANAPIVTAVNDRSDVAKPPAKRPYWRELYFIDAAFAPTERALELPDHGRAHGVNALDEVPDSTWFTNRIGVRTLTPEEIRNGPATDVPERHEPWTVRSTKIGGTSLGYIIVDTSGTKYVLKFEGKDDPPELETGTDVVVDRLLWACGFNVAEDHVVYFRPEELLLAADAAVKNADGETVRKLDRATLQRDLASVRHERDGRIRAMASRWIAGTTLGGHPGQGVRADDPNDRIPHEQRRDLRGQAAIFAWLDALDVTEGQYVDTWVADPRDPERHYVKHYEIDFGKSLGVMAADDHDPWHGSGYLIDFAQIFKSVGTLGAAARPRYEHDVPSLRGVSQVFDATSFDPGSWHPDLAEYLPFVTADRFDKFWGAKLVARFTRAQLRAAVEAGRFSDPRAVDYLTDTLVKRQRAIAAYWFARVNPLDHFFVAVARDELCFDDLAIVTGLESATGTRYTVATFDIHGRVIASAVDVPAALDGRTCRSHVATAPASDSNGYTIVRITTERPTLRGETFVHLGRDPATGTARVIGLWRS